MSTVWMFPGHGSQFVGMGRTVLETEPGRRWLKRAEEMSGQPLGALASRGPLRELTRPAVLEPLLAAVSCTCVDLLQQNRFEPGAVAGYSAGEVSATYAAGAIDADTCMRIACLRGAVLEEATEQCAGGMISIRGLTRDALGEVLDGFEPEASVAGEQGPLHFTVSGLTLVLSQISTRANTCGARVAAMDVAGPWHGPWLESARQELRRSMADLTFRSAQVPVCLGSRGESYREPETLRASLADSIALPVRWHEVVNHLVAAGFCHFMDLGPGRVLWSLVGQLRLPERVTRSFIERPGGPLLGALAQHRRPLGQLL